MVKSTVGGGCGDEIHRGQGHPIKSSPCPSLCRYSGAAIAQLELGVSCCRDTCLLAGYVDARCWGWRLVNCIPQRLRH